MKLHVVCRCDLYRYTPFSLSTTLPIFMHSQLRRYQVEPIPNSLPYRSTVLKLNIRDMMMMEMTLTLHTTFCAYLLQTFILYTWYTGLPLTSDKAFFTITIIQNLSSPLLSFSRSLTHTLSCIVSFKRLEIFFTAPVISGQRYLRHKTDVSIKII